MSHDPERTRGFGVAVHGGAELGRANHLPVWVVGSGDWFGEERSISR